MTAVALMACLAGTSLWGASAFAAPNKKPIKPVGKECGEVVGFKSERHVAIRKVDGNYIYARIAWLKRLPESGNTFQSRVVTDRATYGKEACATIWKVYGTEVVDSSRGRKALKVYADVDVKGVGNLTEWMLKKGLGMLDEATARKVLPPEKVSFLKAEQIQAQKEHRGIWDK
ncbi:hypothetical protein D6779_02175 [Candidatus Parcubacteria bacterium]|nr:MAG: hypothetical protein D6779_02175 [Candidatus Parcubacteria bacterium]